MGFRWMVPNVYRSLTIGYSYIDLLTDAIIFSLIRIIAEGDKTVIQEFGIPMEGIYSNLYMGPVRLS